MHHPNILPDKLSLTSHCSKAETNKRQQIMKIKMVNEHQHTYICMYTYTHTKHFKYDDTPIQMMNNHEEILNRAVLLVTCLLTNFLETNYFSDHNRIINVL